MTRKESHTYRYLTGIKHLQSFLEMFTLEMFTLENISWKCSWEFLQQSEYRHLANVCKGSILHNIVMRLKIAFPL